MRGLKKGNRKGAQIPKEIISSVQKYFRFGAQKIFWAGLLPFPEKVLRAPITQVNQSRHCTASMGFFRVPLKIPRSLKTCYPQRQCWNLRCLLSGWIYPWLWPDRISQNVFHFQYTWIKAIGAIILLGIRNCKQQNLPLVYKTEKEFMKTILGIS